ncbi:glycosyltransferase family 2 protein [Candidatus Pelagibacter sp.]|nr:glycosyltransferase family 2 protein [Candidatus Pelagibacter sp.]
MNNLSIVLSTYNEAHNIEQTLTKLINKETVKEIIIVDDNSSDETSNIINNIKNSKIKLFVRKNTRGFASAFIFGLMMSNGEYVLRFDLDMHSEIDLFINSFEKNKDKDCVIFSRYTENGKDLRGMYRKIPSLIINKLCQFLLSNKIKDYTSCIMFFKKSILKDILPKNTYYANFIIEFIFLLIIKKKNYLEVGFTQKQLTELNSKSSPNIIGFVKNGFFYLLSILRCILFKVRI